MATLPTQLRFSVRRGCLLATIALFVADLAAAQIPVVPQIPENFPPDIRQALLPRTAPLRTSVDGLVNAGKDLNQHCAHFEHGSSLESECISLKQQWVANRAGLQRDVEMMQAHLGMLGQLIAQDQKLTHEIESNLAAIKQLGFDHRAEDIEEWNKLSEEARKQFVDKVKEQAVDLIADKVQDGLLAGTRGFPQDKAAQWISILDKGRPQTDKVIGAIQRLTTTETRTQLAADAGILAQFLKTGYAGWNAVTREQLMDLALDNTCEAAPSETFQAQCKVFRSEAKIVSAEVYYGTATYVARKQVDALTNLSEDQLKALAARNKVLMVQIRDRSEVRSRIKLLLSE
jgi:hypothetical protein